MNNRKDRYDDIISYWIPQVRVGNLNILDVNCGDGFFLGNMREFHNIIHGTEFIDHHIKFLINREIPFSYCLPSVLDTHFEDKTFDIITAINTLARCPEYGILHMLDEMARISRSVIFIVAEDNRHVHELHKWNHPDFNLEKQEDSVFLWLARKPYRYFKDIPKQHKGERCFVIGGGESITDLIVDKGLEIDKLFQNITFGINKSYLLGRSTYHVAMDIDYFKADQVKLAAQNIMVSDTIGRWYPQLKIIKSLNANNSKEFISENFDGVYYGKSSGYLAINIAYIMGCNPIYLLGFDLEGKHFHDGYGKRMNERLEQDHNIIGKELIVGVTEIQARGTTIYSMSPISKLNDYIPFISIRDIIW